MPGALGIAPDSMRLLQRLVTSPSSDPSAFEDAVREGDSFSHAITHAIIDLIDSITSEGPLLLSVDDIPSLDRMSLRLFGYLLSSSRRRRLCVVVTSRDASAIDRIPANHLATIDLLGVDASAVTRLVEAFAERVAVEVDAEMAKWLRETSAVKFHSSSRVSSRTIPVRESDSRSRHHCSPCCDSAWIPSQIVQLPRFRRVRSSGNLRHPIPSLMLL